MVHSVRFRSDAVNLHDLALGLFDCRTLSSRYDYGSIQVLKIQQLAQKIQARKKVELPEGLDELVDNLKGLSGRSGGIPDLHCLWIINKTRLIMRRAVKDNLIQDGDLPKQIVKDLQKACDSKQIALVEKILTENVVDMNCRECVELFMNLTVVSQVELFVKAGIDLSYIVRNADLSPRQLQLLLHMGIRCTDKGAQRLLCKEHHDRAIVLFINGYSNGNIRSSVRDLVGMPNIFMLRSRQLLILKNQSGKMLLNILLASINGLPRDVLNIVVDYHDSLSRHDLKASPSIKVLLSRGCLNEIIAMRRSCFTDLTEKDECLRHDRVFSQLEEANFKYREEVKRQDEEEKASRSDSDTSYYVMA